jgi:hypothetical protein
MWFRNKPILCGQLNFNDGKNDSLSTNGTEKWIWSSISHKRFQNTDCRPRKGIAGSRCTSRLKLPDCFPNWLHHFTFSPQCKSFSHPHQQPWLSVFLSWSPRGYESVTWCLLNSLRAWGLFQVEHLFMFTEHSRVFHGEMLVQSVCPF